MGNQQETVSDFDLGWLAGIIDGEGTISINRLMSHRTSVTYTPRVQIPNTNHLIIEHVLEILEKMGIKGHTEKRYWPVKHQDKGWKVCYIVTFNSVENVNSFLKKMTPYIYGKKEHAKLLLKFTDSRLESRKNRNQTSELDQNGKIKATKRFDTYTEEQIEMYRQLVILNKKKIVMKEIGSSETTSQSPL